MKKVFLLLGLCCAALSALAQDKAPTAYLNQNALYWDFAPMTAVSTSRFVDVRSGLPQYHTIEALLVGTPTTCTFRVEGSNSGVTFYDISGAQDCTTSTMFHIANKPVRYIRISLLALTGTATIKFSWNGVE